MEEVFLIEPSDEYRDEYLDMIIEWTEAGERMIPFVLRYDPSDFDCFLAKLSELKVGTSLDHLTVNSSTFWLVRSDRKVLGAVNIRHELNDFLLERGGHIGYGIRPSERKKGYAAMLLSLALEQAQTLGIRNVLVTCDKDNIASAKTIIANGGILESEVIAEGIPIQRYWIENETCEQE